MGRIKYAVCWLLALCLRWELRSLKAQRADYIKAGWTGNEKHIRGLDYSLQVNNRALARLGWQ